MLEAYDLFPVVERLPKQIESIASYGENLLVGTKEGHLLVYTLQHKSDGKFESILDRTMKTFSKKPIVQIEAIPEYHFVLSLSDSVVCVNGMANFAPICVIEKTRGANYFSTDLQKSESNVLKMCVAVKKKVLLFQWVDHDFEYKSEIQLPDFVKMIGWFGDYIFLAFRKDYSIYKLSDGSIQDLFSVGRQLDPFVLKCGDLIALNRDESTILVQEDGTTLSKLSTTWNLSPISLVYDDPYLIALTLNGIEIRSFDPKFLIQQYELNKARRICINYEGSQKRIYISSLNNIWRLHRRSNLSQIKQLLENNQFELALTLTKTVEESNEDKVRRQELIKNLCAFELFSKHQFVQALDIFAKIRTDPCHIVGLYPDLLPSEFRKQLQFPRQPPILEGHDLEQGLICLIEYLKLKRKEIRNDNNLSDMPSMMTVDGKEVAWNGQQLAQIIDTTLLKCYLQTNDALVSYFLRLRDNACNLKEAERLLKLHNRILDLITLYKSRGMHQKAFEVILQQSQKELFNSDWDKRAIEYLQSLDSEHLNIIFEYSECLLRKVPEHAIIIFTGDTEEAKSLPWREVAIFLQKISNELLMTYLEHVISEWSDESSFIHDMLVACFINVIHPLLLEYLENLAPGERPVAGGLEPGCLGMLRNKCIQFLQNSKFYSTDVALKLLPTYLFFEEKAILYGNCNCHYNSIIIYVYILQDDDAAEKYCLKVFDKSPTYANEIFYLLFRAYASPPDFKFLSDNPPAKYSPFPVPNFAKSIEILRKYITFINPKIAVPLLPHALLLQSLLDILVVIFAKQASIKHQSLVSRHLYEIQHLKMKHRNYSSNVKCIINKDDTCDVCMKKIANSAFVRNTNGTIIHCFCYNLSDG